MASWPRLAPPHVALTGPPPPPKLFLALFLPLLLPPRALTGPPAFELTRGGPPRAVDESRFLPPPPPLLLLPLLNALPAGWRRRVLRTGPFWKSMMAFFSSLGSLAPAAQRFLTASSYAPAIIRVTDHQHFAVSDQLTVIVLIHLALHQLHCGFKLRPLAGGDSNCEVHKPSDQLLEQRDAGHQEPHALVEFPRLECGLVDIEDGGVNFTALSSVKRINCTYSLLLGWLPEAWAPMAKERRAASRIALSRPATSAAAIEAVW